MRVQLRFFSVESCTLFHPGNRLFTITRCSVDTMLNYCRELYIAPAGSERDGANSNATGRFRLTCRA